MAIESVPGTSLKYHLIAFDDAGRERSEGGDRASRLAAAELGSEPVTDVFLLSHGWQGDIPAARDQYRRWIAAMAACTTDMAKAAQVHPGFRPLLIGVHWPSLPWGDERLGAAAASFARGRAKAWTPTPSGSRTPRRRGQRWRRSSVPRRHPAP
jgi:hypothetical protein